jgi:hypothetical protein
LREAAQLCRAAGDAAGVGVDRLAFVE